MEYDTREFTWWLREDKLAVIVNMLLEIEKTDRHKIVPTVVDFQHLTTHPVLQTLFQSVVHIQQHT